MKRLYVALTALCFLIASPAVHAISFVDAICTGQLNVHAEFVDLTTRLPAASGPGRECLKACKSGASTCSKFAKTRLKCQLLGAKSVAKNNKFYCLADRGDKKTCAAQSKDRLLTDLAAYKGEWLVNKFECAGIRETCIARCTP